MENLEITAVETSGSNKNETHMYKQDKEVYMKNNDVEWTKVIETNKEYSASDTSYTNVANALASVKDVIKVVDTWDEIEVSYAGNGNIELFSAFEQPFSLMMNGIDIENESKMNLLFVIDNETKYMKSVHFEITAEKDDVEFILNLDMEYKNINFTKVEIPEEVIAEAG